MRVTEVRIILAEGMDREGKLRAFCSVTFDDAFVVRDLKLIDGTNGLFLSMPARKVQDRCEYCGCKNNLMAKFCNGCSKRQPWRDIPPTKTVADVAHPISRACRDHMTSCVLRAYAAEKEKSTGDGLHSFPENFPERIPENDSPRELPPSEHPQADGDAGVRFDSIPRRD